MHSFSDAPAQIHHFTTVHACNYVIAGRSNLILIERKTFRLIDQNWQIHIVLNGYSNILDWRVSV